MKNIIQFRWNMINVGVIIYLFDWFPNHIQFNLICFGFLLNLDHSISSDNWLLSSDFWKWSILFLVFLTVELIQSLTVK